MARKKEKLHMINLSLVARATCAAPTYFEPVLMDLNPDVFPESKSNDRSNPINSFGSFIRAKDQEHLVFEDGGTTRNNPADLGLEMARFDLKEKNTTDYKFHLLSLGTGMPRKMKDNEDPTRIYQKPTWTWFCDPTRQDGGADETLYSRVQKDAYEVQLNAFKICYKMQRYAGPGSDYVYTRIQWRLKPRIYANMDNVTPKNMKELMRQEVYQIGEESHPNCIKFRKFVEEAGFVTKNPHSPFEILKPILADEPYCITHIKPKPVKDRSTTTSKTIALTVPEAEESVPLLTAK
jgi:hypothetical protein